MAMKGPRKHLGCGDRSRHLNRGAGIGDSLHASWFHFFQTTVGREGRAALENKRRQNKKILKKKHLEERVTLCDKSSYRAAYVI